MTNHSAYEKMPIRSQRMGIEDILTGESTG